MYIPMKLSPQSRWWTCPSPHKIPLYPFIETLLLIPPCQLLLCFLSLKISLHFIEFYINGIIWYILIFVWLLLLSIFIL